MKHSAKLSTLSCAGCIHFLEIKRSQCRSASEFAWNKRNPGEPLSDDSEIASISMRVNAPQHALYRDLQVDEQSNGKGLGNGLQAASPICLASTRLHACPLELR